MSKKKLAGIIAVCAIAIVIVVVVAVLRPTQTQKPPMLVTAGCIDRATNSLKVQGNVTNIGGVLLSRRGFVYMEGTEGDPGLSIISLANPSFESGSLPDGWLCRNSTQVSRVSDDVKVGSYALKYEYPGGGSCPYIRTQTTFKIADWAGKAVTIGAWVKSNSANTRLSFMEWGGAWWATSTYCPGDGKWHWITCATTIPLNLTAGWTVGVVNYNTAANYTFWVDGFFASEGLAVLEDGTFGTGNYSLNITGLKPNTSYRVRAFGENEAGIGYGGVVTCQTLE